jgi:RNA polymerase sigma-70 factor (ECF subfamily)
MSSRQTTREKKTALVDACCDLVLRGRGNRAGDAEDIAQDACVRALGLTQREAVRDPVHYLMRIARNLFVDRQRSRKRESALFRSLGDVEPKAGNAVDPERILAGKQDLRHVLAAIETLPPRCREAFTLHRFHGLSYAAIARRMGVSTGTVEKHIAQAMVRITRSLRTAGENRP